MMKSTKISGGYLLRLVKGEYLMKALTNFCEEHNVTTANLSGIGAALEVELGFYHLDKREYSFTQLVEPLEIVSMQGNVSLVEDRPFLHIHAVFSNAKFQCFGGHVKDVVIGATCEMYLFTHSTKVQRLFDADIGLKLLDLSE